MALWSYKFAWDQLQKQVQEEEMKDQILFQSSCSQVVSLELFSKPPLILFDHLP